MAEGDPEPLQVLIRQLGENVDLDVVLGKALRILGHAEVLERADIEAQAREVGASASQRDHCRLPRRRARAPSRPLRP